MSNLTFDQLRAHNVARAKEYYSTSTTCDDWTINDWFTALVGEVGELGNLLKKLRRGDYNTNDHKELFILREEIADIQIYLDLIAWHCGADLGAITIEKFNVVSDRVKSKVKLPCL